MNLVEPLTRLLLNPLKVLALFLGVTAAAYAFNGKNLGAIVYTFDAGKTINKGDDLGKDDSNVAVVFVVKESTGKGADYAVEVQEIASTALITGHASHTMLKDLPAMLARDRYLSLRGLSVSGLGRSEFAVIGRSAGGKLAGFVSKDGVPVERGFVLTKVDFVFLCAGMIMIGVVIGGLLHYLGVDSVKVASEVAKAAGERS